MRNYGFWMDNKTGRLCGVAPLFDFNMALVGDVFGKDVSCTMSQMLADGSIIVGLAEMYSSFGRLRLNLKKFKELSWRYKEYTVVFQNVLARCQHLGII